VPPQAGLDQREAAVGLEPNGPILNALTIDVEEHFQVSAFSRNVAREDWGGFASRVVPNTERILDLLEEVGVQATFFVLGWVAERQSALVRRIAERGHEIASHGYDHRLVYEQAPAQFREEVRRSRRLLEDAGGCEVRGYRAASFSITRRCLWALDVLADEGFAFDSSLFPVVHDRYGIPGAPREIYRVRTPAGGTMIEVPPSTVRLGGLVLPFGGGGYLRILPLAVTDWAIRRLNRAERRPAVVYLHPWELDPDQPRIRASWKSRFRHYRGLRTTLPKLRALLASFRFGSVSQVVGECGPVAERALS
jgi:polysaccharide deacetylase family protein (PEP-CTERM system associated)